MLGKMALAFLYCPFSVIMMWCCPQFHWCLGTLLATFCLFVCSSKIDISPTGKTFIIPRCTIYIFILVYIHITVPLDGSRDLYRSDPTETRLQFESSLGIYQLRCSNEWMNYFTVFPARLTAINTAPMDSTIHPTARTLHFSFPFCLP